MIKLSHVIFFLISNLIFNEIKLYFNENGISLLNKNESKQYNQFLGIIKKIHKKANES